MPKKTNKKSLQDSGPDFAKATTGKQATMTFKKLLLQFLTKSSLRTKTLLVLGLLLVIIPTFFYVNEGVQLAFFTPKVVPVKNIYAIPNQIDIPQVNISLPIAETAINNGVWQIANDGISHLSISARPGESGSIILYGHNTNDRFGPIRWLNIGQKIVITTSDGKTHEYKIVSTQDVSADKVSVLVSENKEKLILYTCDGFADLQRFVVIALPAS